MTNDREILLRLTSRLQQERRECHRRVLALLDDLTVERIQRRPGPHAPRLVFMPGTWAAGQTTALT
jgi:hypothetical protein